MQEEQRTLSEELTINSDKHKIAFSRIEQLIDRMIELYEQAEQNILNGKEPEKVITDLNDQLLAIKPLKTVRQQFVHYYRKLSALVRRLQNGNKANNVSLSRYSTRRQSNGAAKQQQNNLKFKHFISSFITEDHEKKALERIIVQHYLRQGRIDCAQVWKNREKQLNSNNVFSECHKLKERIKKGFFDEAITWCQNQKLFESRQCLLEYELTKTLIVSLVEKGFAKEALEMYKSKIAKFAKFATHKREQMEKLMGYILFGSKRYWLQSLQQMPDLQKLTRQRYKIFTSQPEKCEELAQLFYKEYLRHNKINLFDVFNIVYGCSKKVSEEYRRLLLLTWQNQHKSEDRKKYENQLPFSIPLDKSYEYHSLFLCPITKQMHTSGDKSVVLSCGHMISQAAQDRIIHDGRGRRRVKCPICQKQIRHEDNISVDF